MILMHCPNCNGAMEALGPCLVAYPQLHQAIENGVIIACTNCPAATEIMQGNKALAEYRGLTVASLAAPYPNEDMTLTLRSLRQAPCLYCNES